MNRYSRTFSAVAFALGTLPVAGLVHAATDAPPTTPATLTANRYSSTGADILWARSTDDKGAVRGYEVFRDGVSLGIRDALSVSEKSLVAGKSYTYSVAAVDSAGQRSAPIRVTLNTKGFSNGASAPAPSANPFTPVAPTTPARPTTPVAPVATLAAPTGLRASTYSSKSGEIFWARPSTPGLRYDVRRDGALVKNTDGVGYYDNALVAGKNHRYEVVAIDSAGRRSAAAGVTLQAKGGATVPGAPTAPIARADLTLDNAERTLVQVFDVLGGSRYGDIVFGTAGDTIGRQWSHPNLQPLRQYDKKITGRFACEYGGSATYELSYYDNGSYDNLNFNQCERLGVTTSGSLVTSAATGRGNYFTTTGRNFVIDRPKAGITFNGFASQGTDDSGLTTAGLTGTLTFPANDSLLGIKDATISRECGDGSIIRNGISEYGAIRRTSGDFTYIPPDASGQGNGPVVAVKTTTGFSYESIYNDGDRDLARYTFEKGKMTLTARDGSKIDIDAATADPSTYRLTVTANGKSVTALKPIEPLMTPFRKTDAC